MKERYRKIIYINMKFSYIDLDDAVPLKRTNRKQKITRSARVIITIILADIRMRKISNAFKNHVICMEYHVSYVLSHLGAPI